MPTSRRTLPKWASTPDKLRQRYTAAASRREIRKSCLSRLPLWPRQARMFAVACARRVISLDARDLSCLAEPLDAVERYADGRATEQELFQACKAARCLARAAGKAVVNPAANAVAFSASGGNLAELAAAWAVQAAVNAAESAESAESAERGEVAAQADLLVAMVRPGWQFSPGWRTAAVTGIARAIYWDRAWSRSPVLADALEEAGCDHPDILAQLREPTFTGFPGEWVVDHAAGMR